MTKEGYIKAQENCGLKVGDVVRVVRKAVHGEDGWDDCWVEGMDKFVEKSAIILAFHKECGIELLDTKECCIELLDTEIYPCSFCFPYFILEKVYDQPPLPIPQSVSQDLWNTTCPVCGKPAYLGLFNIQCSNCEGVK